jgi:hypothetical protein
MTRCPVSRHPPDVSLALDQVDRGLVTLVQVRDRTSTWRHQHVQAETLSPGVLR